MAHTESNILSPTVEQVLAGAAEGPPKPMIRCSAEEAVEVWGAEPNTEMDITDIDGHDSRGGGAA